MKFCYCVVGSEPVEAEVELEGRASKSSKLSAVRAKLVRENLEQPREFWETATVDLFLPNSADVAHTRITARDLVMSATLDELGDMEAISKALELKKALASPPAPEARKPKPVKVRGKRAEAEATPEAPEAAPEAATG